MLLFEKYVIATDLTRHCENEMKGVPGFEQYLGTERFKNSTHGDDVPSYCQEVQTIGIVISESLHKSFLKIGFWDIVCMYIKFT